MSQQPHIIFLMTDQQRWDDLGCMNPIVQTPCMDRLAAQGIRYDQATCQAPMCVPSRYSMMLGLYPSQIGVRNNGQSTNHDSELANIPLAEALRRRGYHTLGFGKTHWYDGRSANAPSDRGFDRIWQGRPDDKGLYPRKAVTWDKDEPEAYEAWKAEQKILPSGGESLEGYMGMRSHIPGSHHREGWLTRKALETLDDIDPTDPTFLYFSLDFPHAGLFVPGEYEDRYNLDDIEERPQAPWHRMEESHRPLGHIEGFHNKWDNLTAEERRMATLRYYASTTYLDDCFEQVLAKCEAVGLLDNAIVVLCSDHGEMLGDRDWRFSKYCLYEGSVRVPLILAGSVVDDAKRGTVDKRAAGLVDLYPTLTEVAGCAPRPELPGSSLLHEPTRLGNFCEMHGAGGRFEPSQRAPALMWRTEEWKLIIHQQGSVGDANMRPDDITGELYHLPTDPVEFTNRYNDPDCQQIREQLTLQLLMHQAQCTCAFSTVCIGARCCGE